MHRTAFSRALAVLAFALAMIAMAGPVRADARTEARAHYAAGKDLFAGGNFRGAIAEFARADALAPSPILQFNIALCYEKLGDDAEALRRYRLYLDKMPSAPNRAAVEAKISAIEAHVAAAKPAPPPPVAAAEAAPPP
ncbi:MAG TPA: hypothetical protein VFG83_18485, partial [Kofleriaceae bacterium]|nr:hypothetical protein [Kofleriaceae bacterium]